MTRADDGATRARVEALNDPPTRAAVGAERALLARLGGGCQLPLGALAMPFKDRLRLWGLVASPDGRRAVRGDLTGASGDPEELGRRLAELLRRRGADLVLGEIPDALSGEPISGSGIRC